MPAEQHIGRAANSDQHHARNADGLMMYAPLEPNAGSEHSRSQQSKRMSRASVAMEGSLLGFALCLQRQESGVCKTADT
jgi:hypothetical protein